MELHPILDLGHEPLFNLWYVISCPDAPCCRVGQACAFDQRTNCLFVIGGADPSTAYNDIFRLNLINHHWSKLPINNVAERYEHSVLLSSDKIYIFGGANKSGNLSSIQLIDTKKLTCNVVECSGETPSPRTMHNAACDGDRLYVWGGGHQGAVPVTDLKLHVFSASTSTWNQPVVKGKLPSSRHGHIMAIVDKNLYIHGGMAGATFHKDMHVINISVYSCNKVKQKGSIPCGRAAHAACVHGKLVYIFGGVFAEGALDDMHCFNTVNHTWAKLSFDSPPPTPRLDHSMLIAHLPYVKKEEVSTSVAQKIERETATPNDHSTTSRDSSSPTKPNIIPVDLWGSSGDDQSTLDTTEKLDDLQISTSGDDATYSFPVILIFGGMDASGNIFNDLLLYRIKTE